MRCTVRCEGGSELLHGDNQLDCVIIIVAERQAKYDHYSCFVFPMIIKNNSLDD